MCIVGRDPKKIDERLKEIETTYSVKTRAVIFDFGKLCLISDYKEKVAD